MRTKLFLVSVLLAFTAVSFAQDKKEAGYKTPFQAGTFGNNWFIQIGAGAQTAFADKNHEGPDIQDRVTLAPTFAFGKWFNPFFGFRIKGDGGALHGFQGNKDDLYVSKPGSAIMIHDRYYAGHVDFMWNMTNYFMSYNPDRVFGFTPYIGLGYIHREYNNQFQDKGNIFHSSKRFERAYNGLTGNGGIMMNFRLSKRVDFHLDFGAILAGDGSNGIVDDCPYDLIASATGGFTFKLGKTDFDVVPTVDYGLINDLNDKINKLRAENDELSKRPKYCPECPEVKPAPAVIKTVAGAPSAVNFRINSAKIDRNQDVVLYNTAQYLKNSGQKVKVVGYADQKTGTAEYNLKLSEKRAKAVADELVKKYNIPSESIIVEWKGSDSQPYPENNWNRVVIVNAQ